MARLKSNKRLAATRPRRQTRRRSRSGPPALALAAFAHDIRTDLTGILALGELLASSNLGERERHWAAAIKSGAQHLASLTTLVIDAAKADADSLTLQHEAFRLRDLIDALADSLSARAQTKGLATEVKVREDLPEMLLGDAVRLRAALENLIDNAVKFTERGTVRLEAGTTRAARGQVKLAFAVTDSGIGLTRAEIKRLFRPFAQANAKIARRYGGAGLGLAVVKHLANLMGGDLKVTSASGRGSSFSFSAVLQVAAAEVAASSAPRRALTPVHRLSILCVEDNPYGRVILNTILTELGHHTDFVNSGEDAIAALPRGYDVVLMDLTLPGIDGLEATRRIRALAGPANATPIVGISGRAGPGDEQAVRSAGMNYYLHKPLSPSALGEAIAAVVRHSGTERSEGPGIHNPQS